MDNLKIDVIYNNPNVGRTYDNHLFVNAIFTANPADQGVPAIDPAALYVGGAFLQALLPSDNPNRRGYQLVGLSPSPGQFVMMVEYIQPHSSGTVRIQSTDPFDISLADNNYLDPITTDLQAFIVAFQTYVKQIAIAFANIDPLYQLVSPPMAVLNDPVLLEQYIIDNFVQTHHWMGSNQMAKTMVDGVVDGYGNVFGVDNLVVADGSIAPIISDGNTSGPIYVISNVIADHLIQNKYGCGKICDLE